MYNLHFISEQDFEMHIIETIRQKTKSNKKVIAYFHQNIFKYIDNCDVLRDEWDIIVKHLNEPIMYVRMINKQSPNPSSQKIYTQMLNQIWSTPSNNCFLVEFFAPMSRDIIWECTVNKQRFLDYRIRKVSIDRFYELVTGDKNAFYNLCIQLSKTIENLIASNTITKSDTLQALYTFALNSCREF